MKLQVEEALKEAGKSFPFSFECPAAELGEVDDLPWKDATVVVDGAYWKHCLKSMVRKQSFPRTYCPIMGNTSI